MGLKDLYYSIEDKWYSLMDSLQEKGIPVNKIIEPIDKIIPSLIVFSLIFLLLITGIGLMVFSSSPTETIFEGNVLVKLNVLNENNEPVPRALIEVTGLSKKIEETTSSNGEIEFSVPINSEIRVKVSKKDFIDFSTNYFIDSQTTKTIILIQQVSQNYSLKKIYFANQNGNTVTESINVNFQCSNPQVTLPESNFTGITSGNLELNVPNNCGTLLADVFAEGYETNSYSLQSGDSIIKLSEIHSNQTQQTGTLIIKVLEKETSTPLNGINLEVRNSKGQLIEVGTTNHAGEKYFSLLFDSYTVKAVNPNQEHVMEIIEVNLFSGSKYKEIELSKDYFGKIKLTAIDSESNQEIPAVIILRKGIQVWELSSNEEELEVVFLVEEAGKYYVRAVKEEYISGEEIEIELNEKGEITEKIFIEPCTPEKCSAIKVYVIDENQKPVENALVNLNYAETGFIKPETTRTTDLNGLIQPVYSLIEPGKYFASATKYPASGQSPEFEVIKGEEQEIIIDFSIGNALIEVKVNDSYGQAIPFARVEFLNPAGENLGSTETDEEGYLLKEMKADKQIYLRITKEGFTPFITYVTQLYPNQLIKFNAVLEKEILGNKPLIEFKGLFELNSDYLIEFPEPARTYNALFEVSVPSNQSFDEIGLHLRTGFSERIEKDDLFISEINAPNSFVLKGKTFNQETHENEIITNGEAKWVNIILQSTIPGKYLIQAEIKIKPTFVPQTELPIYFRAWGKKGNEYLRDPIDEELGTALNSNEKKALYANAYAKIYFEAGKEPPCFEEFCFFEKIYDFQEEMFLTEPYSMRIDSDYNYSFTIINNSEIMHDNATLRIRNTTDLEKTGKEIELMNYSVFNAERKEFSSTESMFELPWIDLGEFSQNKQINGKISLKPRIEGESYLELLIVSEGNIVFSKLISLNVFYQDEMNLMLSPEIIPAFSPSMIEVELKESEEETPINAAEIKVTRKTSNGATTNYFSSTNSYGKTRILIPASNPGTEIIFTARKPGFNPIQKTIKVTENVIEFNPESVSSELNWFTKKDSRTTIEMHNVTSRSMEISDVSLSGEQSYPLDLLRMNNWFQEELKGKKINAETQIPFDFLMVLSAEAASMQESTQSKGELLIELTDYSSYWIQQLPFTAMVSSEQQAKESNCLTVQPINWKQNILGGTARTNELMIINNCVNDLGEPLALKKLEAKINWQTNVMGNVVIELSNEFGEYGYGLLEQGRTTEILSDVYPNEMLFGSIEFIPQPDFFGQTAKFAIEFSAELGGENPPTINGSNPVSAEINLVDLMQCVYIDEKDDAQDGLIQIMPEEEETIITIDLSGRGDEETSNYCSQLEFDLEFCKDDPRCAGGIEGGIDVMIGARAFKADNVKEEVGVTIRRGGSNIPGIYGITVYARVKGKGAMQKITELDLIVHPRERDWMYLDKYAFEIYGDSTNEFRETDTNNSDLNLTLNQDLLYLTNKKFIEPVLVKANLCNWGKSKENWATKMKGWGIGIGAGGLALGVGITNTAVLNIFFFTSIKITPIGWIILGTGVIIELISDIFGKDCSDYFDENELMDYVIDVVLGNREIDLILPNKEFIYVGKEEPPPKKFEVKFNRDSQQYKEPIEINDDFPKVLGQQAELIILNHGFETEEPFYALLSMSFNEDIHGDERHIGEAEVFCENGNFGPYNIGPTHREGSCKSEAKLPVTTKIHREKFRVRITTKEIKPEIPTQGEFTQCEMGIRKGITGTDAVPKIKWNWNWTQIPDSFCDTGGNEIVYCDATQFSITISKKLNKLYEFLKENSFNLGCPTTELPGNVEKTYEEERGKINITRLASIVSGKNARIEIDLTNNASSTKTVDLNIFRIDENDNLEEIVLTETVSRNQTKTITRTFTNLNNGIHTILVFISNPLNEDDSEISSIAPQISFNISDESSQKGTQETCWLEKTTAFISGKPGIMHFIEANPNTRWTTDVPNAIALRELLSFNVYLMKDGFSTDFKNDFVDYYTNKALPPAETYFFSMEQNMGLKDLFLQNKINFKSSNGSNQLISPGVYLIKIEAEFDENWRFFKDGFIETNITIKMHKLMDPTPNNAFYYLPLNGLLGVEGDGMERTGYGVTFINMDLENPVYFTTGTNALKTFMDLGSNPLELITVEKIDSFEAINSNIQNHGNIFSLRQESGGLKMNFSPNNPTPILMKVSAEKTNEKYSTYFRMKENEGIITNALNLGYWTGAGRCLDFTGVPIREKFLNSKDRKATQEDEKNTALWNSSYALDWDSINYSGDVFLHSIFYAPQGKSYQFETNALAKSIGGYGKTIDLISGNTFNAVEEIFPLIEAEYICVSQTGNSTSFWWNPKKILEESGIWNEINSLNAEKGNCIG